MPRTYSPLTAAHRRELVRLAGEAAVLTGESDRERYGSDETEAFRFPPAAVVLPAERAQVARLLAFAHAEQLPVTPRGAGTGLSGGALPVCGGIVLGLERLGRILAIDERDLVAEVEAGVVTAELQRRAEAVGLCYPVDPGSRETSTLGGNVAEDAAGPRSCKFGTTRRWVLGLEAVLADGTTFTTGGRNRKDAAGYELTQLLVGSEGTLAVVTAATLRLMARPRASLTVAVPFADLEPAAAAVAALFRAGHDPAACELLEAAALAAVARQVPVPPQLASPGALVLLEFLGDDPEQLLDAAAALAETVVPLAAGEPLVATDAAEQRRLWQLRSRVGEAVRRRSVYKEADTVVPRSALAPLVRAARAAAARHGLEAVCYGHAGDGNLHVNLLRGGLPEPQWASRRDAAEEELFQAVVGLGGTITGEHGVGWTQRRYLPLAASPGALAAMRAIKRALDPRGILNPGKIFLDETETSAPQKPSGG